MNKILTYLIIRDLFVPFVIIIIIIFGVIYFKIKNIFNKLFRKNCFECKNYKLNDVASCGDRCWYKCNKKDIKNAHSMNDREYYVKCDKFDKESE